MAFLKQKIKGATLIETLVAMTILAVTLTVGLMIFIQIDESRDAVTRMKAMHLAEKVSKEMEEKRDWTDSEFSTGNFVVNIRVNEKRRKEQALYIVRTTVYDKGKTQVYFQAIDFFKSNR